MKAKHDVMDTGAGKFNSANGRVISLHSVCADDIWMDDIVAGLSKVTRFGGQCSHFYSVAQHSVLVATMAPKELRFAALLHDASEAYLGDIIKPLKVILGDAYKELEDKFMAVICDKYHIVPRLMDEVKQYDVQAFLLEHEALQCGNQRKWYLKMNALGLPPEFLLPEAATRLFNTAFEMYK